MPSSLESLVQSLVTRVKRRENIPWQDIAVVFLRGINSPAGEVEKCKERLAEIVRYCHARRYHVKYQRLIKEMLKVAQDASRRAVKERSPDNENGETVFSD